MNLTVKNNFVEIYKTCNTGTTKDKYDLIKSGKLQVPRYIDVELTNMCNFQCRFCPTGTKSMQRTKGFMPDKVVEALVDNVSKYKIPGVRFIRWGEPTLHPKYIEILRRVKETGAMIHLNTNGFTMDAEQINALIDIPLDSIKFSFQGADENSYGEMRKGGNYLKLLATVKLMHDARTTSGGGPLHSNLHNIGR